MNKIIVLTPLELEALIQKTVTETIETVCQDFLTKYEATKKKEILTLNEVCQLLSLAKQTVYRLTSRGEIPYFKNGRKLYFKQSLLLEWIDKGRRKTNAELQEEAIDYVNRKRFKR
jgi:excisionase family DNA binding protein